MDAAAHIPVMRAAPRGRASQRTMSLALSNLSRVMDGTRFNEHIECSICLLDFEEADHVTPLPCDKRHYFHTDCIKQWARMKLHCPLCTKPFTRQELDDLNKRFSVSIPRVDAPITAVSENAPLIADNEIDQEDPWFDQ